jgi:hypothetical protein
VAELFERRSGALAELAWCCADGCDVVAAEVSAAQNISHARAVGQVQLACALKYRLPSVAKVFLRGTIDFRVVSMIIARTENVEDEVMPGLDEAIARRVEKWMKLSKNTLRDRVDQWVAKFDAAGVRVPPVVADNRYVDVESASPGMAYVAARVRAADAATINARLEALAATVCANDPRTHAQRRADASGAMGRYEATLACECGREDCPAGALRADAAAAAGVVIHVLAEQTTLEGSSDNPGYLGGFGIMPAESVRDLAASATATVKPLPVPDAAVAPAAAASDAGYRPTAAIKEFVRWRDLTCRWPGCDKPVDKSDVDHTVPYPFGPTHPSNTKHYCRMHHLIKTFHAGRGWSDRQLPDGTLVLTAPTGHVYTSAAHGAALFPALSTPTGELDIAPYPEPSEAARWAKMPRRKQTREQNRRDRINAERRQRTELIGEEQRQRQAWLAANYQPPPF